MTVETVEVDSWQDLAVHAFDDRWCTARGEFHSNLIHRGMSNSTWALKTSLQRNDLVALETSLVRNFKKYSRVVGSGPVGPWEWLSLAQHHGLPTRVLDWTYSPLVALHFATDNRAKFDVDGVVWSIDFVEVSKFLPAALKEILHREKAAAFTTTLLDGAGVDPFAMPGSVDGDVYAVIFEPPSLDERIVNQYAGLSALSDNSVSFDEWLAEKPVPLARKLILRRSLKAEIREKLDQSNVNERVIYPGLDGLAQWLTRYYSTGARSWL